MLILLVHDKGHFCVCVLFRRIKRIEKEIEMHFPQEFDDGEKKKKRMPVFDTLQFPNATLDKLRKHMRTSIDL